MTPQSTFFVLAPIKPGRDAELRQVLASMNEAPGRLKSDAPIPFASFDVLHMARLIVLDDKTVDDTRVYRIPPPNYPLYLAFLGDVDGDADAFLAALAARSADALRRLFSCCEGFEPDTDLVAWMRAHAAPPAASYVNWRGRTVRRVREESALRDALVAHARSRSAELSALPPRRAYAALRQLVERDVEDGRLTLTPDAPTPLGWWIRNAFHFVAVPIAVLLLSPILLLAALIGAVPLRLLEKRDPELCGRTDPALAAELAVIEDHDVTNQFSAMGSLKPGLLRAWTTRVVLLAIDYAAGHFYKRGRLARVRTIHFARWVYLDDRQRILFASNYDGSLESYMDDFINKVGFGLNVVFSNGIGYPTSRWLIADGCHDERKFKEYLRRHQMPTQVWYKAYPGLTAIDLERNGRIRAGLESAPPTDREASAWLALL